MREIIRSFFIFEKLQKIHFEKSAESLAAQEFLGTSPSKFFQVYRNAPAL